MQVLHSPAVVRQQLSALAAAPDAAPSHCRWGYGSSSGTKCPTTRIISRAPYRVMHDRLSQIEGSRLSGLSSRPDCKGNLLRTLRHLALCGPSARALFRSRVLKAPRYARIQGLDTQGTTTQNPRIHKNTRPLDTQGLQDL